MNLTQHIITILILTTHQAVLGIKIACYSFVLGGLHLIKWLLSLHFKKKEKQVHTIHTQTNHIYLLPHLHQQLKFPQHPKIFYWTTQLRDKPSILQRIRDLELVEVIVIIPQVKVM